MVDPGALPEPVSYDFYSRDYWIAVDEKWEQEKREKQPRPYCRICKKYDCPAVRV